MTQQYVGTKQVTAWPQLGGAKVSICGRDCHPDDGTCNGYCTGEVGRPPEVAQVEGYAVKYPDGYVSWSPKAVFEEAYLPLGHIDHLPPFKQRVIAEKAQLDDRLEKLEDALGKDLPRLVSPEELARLRQQARVMAEYSQVLAARITAFGGAQ